MQKASAGEQAFSDVAKFSYEQLIDRENIPEGVDLQYKEVGASHTRTTSFAVRTSLLRCVSFVKFRSCFLPPTEALVDRGFPASVRDGPRQVRHAARLEAAADEEEQAALLNDNVSNFRRRFTSRRM